MEERSLPSEIISHSDSLTPKEVFYLGASKVYGSPITEDRLKGYWEESSLIITYLENIRIIKEEQLLIAYRFGNEAGMNIRNLSNLFGDIINVEGINESKRKTYIEKLVMKLMTENHTKVITEFRSDILHQKEKCVIF